MNARASFSADDVFEMAERIETQGARFFAALARFAPSPLARQTLTDLAKMEEDHIKTFAGLRTVRLAGRLKPTARAKAYSQMVALMCLDVEKALAESLTGREPVEEIIRKAIDFEKSTIVFYAGMKEMMPDPRDRRSIDAILREELGHVLSLSGFFLATGAAAPKAASRIGNPLHTQADTH